MQAVCELMALILKADDCLIYPGSPGYRAVEDFEFVTMDGRRLIVPQGFWYNGASIPAAFWQLTFTPFDPRIIEAACIHDWLYTCRSVEREIADKTLVFYMRKSPSVKIRSWLVGAAVRTFGNFAWQESLRDREYREHIFTSIIRRGKNPADYGFAAMAN